MFATYSGRMQALVNVRIAATPSPSTVLAGGREPFERRWRMKEGVAVPLLPVP